MFVAISEVDNDGPNVRTIAPPPEAEAEFERSIQAQGILQALLVRPVPPHSRLQVVLGHRRYAVAKKLGMIEIPVIVEEMTDAQVCLAQLSENMQRATMHPVDQWRNICSLILDGTPIGDISDALGLDERGIRRMEQLGRLNKQFLKMAEISLPPEAALRVIANAPARIQAQVAGRGGLIEQRGDKETINWHVLADRCRIDRIERVVAIFDTGVEKIQWDQDLFAQPGADDEWTTREIEKFIVAQTKALQAQVKAAVAAGKRHQIVQLNARGEFALPRGFQQTFGSNAEKLKRNETLFHAVMPGGQVETLIAVDTSGQKKAADAAPQDPPPRSKRDVEAEDLAEDNEADDDPFGSDDDEGGHHPLVKAGQSMVAHQKNAALQARLAELGDDPEGDPLKLIRLFVIALCSNNVEVRDPNLLDEVNFLDLSRELLEPGGNLLQLGTPDILRIGYTALARMLKFGGPNSYEDEISGYPAETIGHIVNAQEKLPRFDTTAFLRTVKSPTLRNCAIAHEMKPAKSAAALREQLQGKMPLWRPPGASFGIAAPRA